MRSTSGITCCHFFCSAVFSMPVWRYPIVGAAERIVSPSSSRTSRSTPCVLGCCGPMLTVITSVLMSGNDCVSFVSFVIFVAFVVFVVFVIFVIFVVFVVDQR